jgi:predicted acyl esterase
VGASWGFQVLVQSVRGTFGAGGVFEPFRQERDDGLATLDWVVAQPWFGDSIVLAGPATSGTRSGLWPTGCGPRSRRWSLLGQGRRRRRALRTLPLAGADVIAAGRRVGYVQDILTDDRKSERWAGIDHRHRVTGTTVPVSTIAGWYDIFLPGQLEDFRSSARSPRRSGSAPACPGRTSSSGCATSIPAGARTTSVTGWSA